ncbi:MAG: hypothetical protein Q6367_016590 [Candidatus Freyarchaeota archaeon]
MLGVCLSPEEALNLVLSAVETATVCKSYSSDRMPKVLVNAVINLSGKLLPVYAVVLQDEKHKTRCVKTVWIKLETI